MDHFMEEVVVRKKRFLFEFLYAVSNVAMVLFAILGMMLITPVLSSFTLIGAAIVVILLAGAVLLFLRKDRLRSEYEYTFTNGELDFAKVFNNQKRKSLGTMKVNNVEAFGSVTNGEFHKMVNMPGLKRRNWFLNRQAKLYYFYYQKESNKNMIVFEPSDELVGMIRKYLPRGAYRD